MTRIGKWFDQFSHRLGEALQDEQQTQDMPAENDSETATQSANVAERQDYQVESKEHLRCSIVSTLTKRIEDRESTNGKELVIWLDCDQMTFMAYDTEAYKQQVLSALSNERGFGFELVSFCIGKPAEELHATRIGNNSHEQMQIKEPCVATEQTVACNATVSIFGNAGSLLQERYILSSEEMKQKMLPAYNIGAGQFPVIPNGYRENHIAIDDNPNSPMCAKNQYVSRMHAHIGFSDKYGFYLQVEPDGTRLMGKRTRIFRGEEKIECDNPHVKVPMHNGDMIELGKAVVLRFELQ